MNRLLLIRHGESAHTVQGLMGGWVASPLTPLGEDQAGALTDHLAQLALPAGTRLYASDLPRAVQTARILSERLGLEPTLMPQLREIHTGDAAGLPKTEAAKVNAPAPDVPDLDWRPNQSAETYREMAQRLSRALEHIEQDCAGTALVVGHGLSGQEMLRAWLRLPLEAKIAFRFDAGSLTEAGINEWGERELERLNVTFGTGSDLPAAQQANATSDLEKTAAGTMLHHVSLPVRDLTAAARLYDAALGCLGYRRVSTSSGFAGYGIEEGRDKLALMQTTEPGEPRPRFHLAIAAPSRGAVDAFHQTALTCGAGDNGPPGLRPHYGRSYYAAFIVDLDGHHIEAVCRTD